MNFTSIKTVGGYSMGQVSSAFQKAIRRGLEEDAIYWLYELVKSGEYGYSGYAWKRLKVIASEDIGPAEPNLPANLAALYASWVEGGKESKAANAKRGENHHPETLFLVHAVVLCCRARKSRLVNDVWLLLWRGDRAGALRREIPDYALDQHTGKGRSMGRGIEHFIAEGAKIENETLENPYRERVEKMMIEQDGKKSAGGAGGRITPPRNRFFEQPDDEDDDRFGQLFS